MSQWGISKTFNGEFSRIKVIPHVRTDTFDPATPRSVIDSLTLLGVEGDRLDGGIVFAGIKRTFEGQPYHLWLESK